MEEQKISMDLPSCKLVGAGINSDTCGNLEDKTRDIQDRSESLAQQQKVDIAHASVELYSCIDHDLVDQKNQADVSFEGAINMLEAAIESILSGGADPSRVMADGEVIDMRSQLKDLIQQRELAAQQFDVALEQIREQQRVSTAIILDENKA